MKPTFLHIVAQDLFRRFGTQLDQLVIVFPNKRASLFLNQEFVSIAQENGNQPFWAPDYQTIGDLFESLSPYTSADPIVSICLLYDIYRQHIGEDNCEPIDKFYSWGEVMISDFNEIDKQLVEADKLFQYAEDWNQLSDTGDFLHEKQIEILKHYFKDFSLENLQIEKERFLQLWQRLPDIYHDFKKRLIGESILYDGALCRDVIEENRFQHLEKNKTYIFVGFNILSPVQYRLLRSINEQAKALFYWDYDPTRKDAGLDKLIFDTCSYIDQYINHLPNALNPEAFKAQSPDSVPNISFIRTNTTNAQSRYVPEWLKQSGMGQNTAVILADEALLPQVLHTLPETTVNITMGYALSDTPVLGMVTVLMDLQLKGRKRKSEGFYEYYRRRVEQHPLFHLLDSELWDKAPELTPQNLLDYLDQNVQAMLGKMPSLTDEVHMPLYVEAIFRTHNALRHLIDLDLPINDCGLISRLLERALRSIKVPFHGEPLVGLQVMGMLESRSLDFENILILSATDGVLPRAASTNSLIPYCMREPFGLATESENVNVYAYNFFRLLKRARNVTLMFPAGKNESEMSRFMRQLLAETDLPISDNRLDFAHADLSSEQVEEPVKTQDHINNLLNKWNGNPITDKNEDKQTGTANDSPRLRALSPSAVNTYIACPKQFYYKYILNLKITKEINDQLDSAQFGTLFHKGAELLYKQIAPDNQVTGGQLDSVNDAILENVVDQAFKEEIFDKDDNEISDFTGQLTIARSVIITYLKRLVAIDKKMTPFRLVSTESNHYNSVSINIKGKDQKVFFGGTIDRIDFIEKHPKTGRPALRIVDYKTGGKTDNKKLTIPAKKQDKSNLEINLDPLFEIDSKDHKKNILQTLLYADTVLHDKGFAEKLKELKLENTNLAEVDIIPELIYIEHCGNSDEYDGRLEFNDTPLDRYQDISDNVGKLFTRLLKDEILNCTSSDTPPTIDSTDGNQNPSQHDSSRFTCTSNTDHTCKYCDYYSLCKSPIPQNENK